MNNQVSVTRKPQMPVFCFNGSYNTEPDIEVLLRSEGLQFGLGLFETIRIHDSEFKDFAEHLHRLRMSALELDIPLPHVFQESSEEALKELLNPLLSDESAGVLRLQVAKVGENSQWWAATRPLPYTEASYYEGFQLGISAVIRHSSGLLLRHKTTNYSEMLLLKKKASQRGLDDLLLLNEEGHVTEGTICNFFYLVEGLWYTPPVSDGLLPGVVRSEFIRQLKQIGQFGAEQSVDQATLMNSKRIYASNSLFGLMPVKAIEETVFETNMEEHKMFMNQLGF